MQRHGRFRECAVEALGVAVLPWGDVGDVEADALADERLERHLVDRRRVLARIEMAQRIDVRRTVIAHHHAEALVPRELSVERLEQIQHAFSTLREPVTAAEVAARAGVSRVTARRYLEYLVTVGQATTSALVSGRGRPTKTYASTMS
jgi:response regulator of citrate/malate metabolism